MKRLSVLLVLVWLPFVSIFGFASPALTEEVGDSYPHMAFHVFSPLLLGGAFVNARGLHREAGTRLQRGLLRGLTVTLPLAVLGNLAELGTAVARFAGDDWESRATPDVFEESGPHLWASNLTIPTLMASMLLVLALLVAHAVQSRRG